MMTNDPDQIRTNIEETRTALAQDVDALGNKVSPSKVAQRQKDRLSSAISSAKDAVFGTASDVTERGREVTGSLRDAAASAPSGVTDKTRGNPLAAGVVAFGVGMLAAALLPATRAESQAVRAVRENEGVQQAAGELKGAAQEIGSSLQEPTAEAMASIKETATEGVQRVKETATSGAQDVAGEARHAGESVTEQAQHAREAVQDDTSQ